MKEKTKRTGRIPKLNPKTHCVMVRFDDEEHARFLTMYEQSGEYAKAVFIKAMVLLYKLEGITRELVAVSREVVALTQKFEREWSPT